MTDLDERHDWLDARIHRAAHDLRATAERRPVPSRTTAPTRPPYTRPLALVAVAAAVVLGLVLLVSQPTVRPAADDRRPEDLRFVVDGLPAAWRVTAVKDQGDGSAPDRTGRTAIVLGTPGDLAGPAMWLSWMPHGAEGEAPGPHDVGPEFKDLGVPGVDATCNAPIYGGYQCLVDASVGNVEVDARNMTLAQVRTVVAGLRVAFGTVSVESGSLPAGMVEFARGPQPMDPSFFADERSYSSVSYAPTNAADNSQNALLMVTWDEGLDIATLAMVGPWQPTTVAGHPAFTYRFDFGAGVRSVFWTDGTRRFLLSVHGLDVDPVALAESVRPATPAEWTATP